MTTMKRNIIGFKVTLIALVLTACMSGCRPARDPFLMVQLCVVNEQGLSLFKSELQSIAQLESMKLEDLSQYTKQNLDAVGYSGPERANGGPVVNVQLVRNDGMGIGAVNLGLPAYQIALGFAARSDSPQARDIAKQVVDRLSKRWKVVAVPSGRGALPITDCN
jgi:hypothetical protein